MTSTIFVVIKTCGTLLQNILWISFYGIDRPIGDRIDGLTVEYTSGNLIEAYKTFELLVLAASAVSNHLADVR
jgi:hypothetical protein